MCHAEESTLGKIRKENIPAQQDNDGIALGGDEAEQEDVLASTVVALEGSFSEGRKGVEHDFLVLGTHKMVNDV
jgi:hypothetical protein